MSSISAKTKTMVQLALLSALIIVLSFTPIGYINLGFISATTIHIPVIIGAILMGPKAGGILGLVFGLTSLFKNTFMPNLTSFCFSPFYSSSLGKGGFVSLIICLVPRILVGIVAALLFRFISRYDKSKVLACAISALVASLVNTFLVMSGIYLFFGESYAAASNTVFSGFFKSISLFIGTVGVPEAIVAAVLATVIARPLITILQKGK